ADPTSTILDDENAIVRQRLGPDGITEGFYLSFQFSLGVQLLNHTAVETSIELDQQRCSTRDRLTRIHLRQIEFRAVNAPPLAPGIATANSSCFADTQSDRWSRHSRHLREHVQDLIGVSHPQLGEQINQNAKRVGLTALQPGASDSIANPGIAILELCTLPKHASFATGADDTSSGTLFRKRILF